MHKDEPPATNETGDGIITSVVRRRICIYMLLLGVPLGMLVGMVNIAAIYKNWSLQRDSFDIVDAPVKSLVISPSFDWGVTWTTMLTGSDTSYYCPFRVVLVINCYWAIIGSFLASLICLVRMGVVRDITRDKICRYSLFFGTCFGICFGGYRFLAASNGWVVPDKCFEFLKQPFISIINAVQARYNILPSLAPGPEFIFWNTVSVIYWTVVCFFLSFICCVVRILIKRRTAREAHGAAEPLTSG